MPNKFYITTAIPYVNATPHVGFAFESILADALARAHRARGEDVFFLTGTDENALKNARAARDAGIPTKEFVDKNAARFKDLKQALSLSWDDFIRTTEARHISGAQKLWSAVLSEDIYQKEYTGYYCVGCEEFKMEKDLVDGHCSEHPTLTLEKVTEKNYFFRLSAYQEKIRDLLESDTIKILPETRKHEMLAFVNDGLEDFSISRSAVRAENWGIPVPNDSSQVMYVWFDALTNYLTALGYADDSELFEKYWAHGGDIVHVIGKGVTRFHAIYWIAILLSANISLPKVIAVHGYVTIDGKKMSKSLGNVLDPFEIAEKYSADALRYYLLREIPSSGDGDVSDVKIRARYEGDLANGLGNFVARVEALAEKTGGFSSHNLDQEFEEKIQETKVAVIEKIDAFKLHEALAAIWELIAFGDFYVNDKKVWAIENVDEKSAALYNLVVLIDNIGALIAPFLPRTSEKIINSIRWEGDTLTVKRGEVLFPRLG